MTEYVQLLGTDQPTASAGVYLWSEETRCAFNVPEGCQRYTSEAKIRLTRIQTYFFTRCEIDTMMGLPGATFTVNDAGVSEMEIIGPLQELQTFWRATEELFFGYRKFRMTIRDAGRNDDVNATFIPKGPTSTATNTGSSTNCCSKWRKGPFSIRAFLCSSRERIGGPVYSYLCYKERARAFLPQKAKELGVKPGIKYAQLKAGVAVQSDQDTSRWIHPDEVLSFVSTEPLKAVLIVDCESAEFLPRLESLIEKGINEAEEGVCNSSVLVSSMVHVAPSRVTCDSRYQKWVKEHQQGCMHLFGGCHTSDADEERMMKKDFGVGREEEDRSNGIRGTIRSRDCSAFPTALARRYHFQTICPEMFPDDMTAASCSTVAAVVQAEKPDTFYASEEKEKFWIYNIRLPVGDINTTASAVNSDGGGIDSSLPLSATMRDTVQYPTFSTAKSMLSEEFLRHVENLKQSAAAAAASEAVTGKGKGMGVHDLHSPSKEAIASTSSPSTCAASSILPEISVSFLGTGSAVPSKYRNVTSILLGFGSQKKENFLLDCGEGTLGQLWNLCGQNERSLRSVINKLCGIFISHLHADHHLGLFSFLEYVQLSSLHVAAEESRLQPPSMVDAKEMKSEVKPQQEPLLVVCPKELKEYIDKTNLFHFRKNGREIVFETLPLCGDGSLHSTSSSALINKFCASRSWSLFPFPVDHPGCAHGLRLSTPYGSVVYSGDTRPADITVTQSQRVDLLIHEASFDDEMKSEATLKKHSTVSEALGVVMAAKPKYAMFTHFSQRYPRVASSSDKALEDRQQQHQQDGASTNAHTRRPDKDQSVTSSTNNTSSMIPIGVAADLLYVPSLPKITLLASLLPAFQQLSAEYDSWTTSSSKRMREVLQK